MNTKKMTAFIVGAMLIATVLVMAVSAAGMERKAYADMPRMAYEFDADDSTGIYINEHFLRYVPVEAAIEPDTDDVPPPPGEVWVPTVRIYGETDAIYPTQSYYGVNDFVYPNPVDPFDPGVLAKDSITFNPAYMDEKVTIDGGLTWDDEKVFFRVFYEPGYAHDVDALMDDVDPYDSRLDNVAMDDGAILTETTYMLVENNDLISDPCSIPYNTGHSGRPITGAAGVTQFTMPISSPVGGGSNPGMDDAALVNLTVAENGGDVTNGAIEVEIIVHLRETGANTVRFMDHSVKLVEACIGSSEAQFDIGYIGNIGDLDHALSVDDVFVTHYNDNLYVTRYNNQEHPPKQQFHSTDAEHRWYLRVIDIDGDCNGCTVVVGRRLVAGETFYVDGVRYDMPAIYVADNDEFKYITLQSPIPKCLDDCCDQEDESHVSCQWLASLCLEESVWVLPPFNALYTMIDDIDLVKEYDSTEACYYLDTEAGNIINNEDKGPLDFYYVSESEEHRFNSSLAERHHIRKDGVEIWNWWNIYTKPYAYTELVLQDLETDGDTYLFEYVENCILQSCDGYADGTEYLVTTSFIAPNSEADEREELCKSSDMAHDIVDRASSIALGEDVVSRGAYDWMPRTVFEYDAVDTDDLFVNDYNDSPTVRVYGEAGAMYPTHTLEEIDDLAKDFIYPDPVDPFDPGIIPKGSVTFNPAYIHDEYNGEEIKIDYGFDGDEKVYLRVFYEPGYSHNFDYEMDKEYPAGLRSLNMPEGAIITETTYMLIEYSDDAGVGGSSGQPIAGQAGEPLNSPTRFMLPINSNDANVPGMDNARVVELTDAVCGDKLTSGEIEVSMTWDAVRVDGASKKFMDHKIKYKGLDTDGNPLVDVWYVGNMYGESDSQKTNVDLVEGVKTYVDRSNLFNDATSPRYRWFVNVQNTWNDGNSCKMTLGRRLVAGETFYVDGVRYDMPAVYVTDDAGIAKFKYITLQSPLPKCNGPMWDAVLNDNQWDWSHVTSQWLANIVPEPLGDGDHDVTNIWVLPPFNEAHTMIDDIDLDKSWDCEGVLENISVEEAGKILGEVCPLEFYYIAEDAELRFDSSLAERHAYDGSDEIWNWWSIFTKPCQYTELVLPDQETTEMSDGNEYLVTTSFIAPNCEGAVRDMDDEPFCKPYDTHDIIDRASTLVEPDAPTRFEGDVNDDTIYPAASPKVTGADAQLAAQHIVGTAELTGEDAQAADVNDDDPTDPGVTPKITGADLQLIKQYIVGTITEFPAGVNGQCIP